MLFELLAFSLSGIGCVVMALATMAFITEKKGVLVILPAALLLLCLYVVVISGSKVFPVFAGLLGLAGRL